MSSAILPLKPSHLLRQQRWRLLDQRLPCISWLDLHILSTKNSKCQINYYLLWSVLRHETFLLVLHKHYGKMLNNSIVNNCNNFTWTDEQVLQVRLLTPQKNQQSREATHSHWRTIKNTEKRLSCSMTESLKAFVNSEQFLTMPTLTPAVTTSRGPFVQPEVFLLISSRGTKAQEPVTLAQNSTQYIRITNSPFCFYTNAPDLTIWCSSKRKSWQSSNCWNKFKATNLTATIFFNHIRLIIHLCNNQYELQETCKNAQH